MVGLAGLTTIDVTTGAIAVNVVDPATPLSIAVMTEEPVDATAVARPVGVMVATEIVAEAQVTWLVKSNVELSEKVPVAVNCWVAPLGTLGPEGVTAIDTRVTLATVSVVEPVTPSSTAE